MTEERLLADRLRYLSRHTVGLREALEIVDSLPRIVAMLDMVADLREELESARAQVTVALRASRFQLLVAKPRYFSGCLLDGECRGVCRNFDCPNHGMVVAARVCVEPKEDGILYPTTEGMK